MIQPKASRRFPTFVDSVYPIIRVGSATMTISKDVFSQVPIMFRVWTIEGILQYLQSTPS